MRWRRARRADRTDSLIKSYFDRQIDRIAVPPPPGRLSTAAATHRARSRQRGPAPFGRSLPNLVCALALAAGFAFVVLNIGRPSSLGALLEARADRYGWTTIVSGTLDAAQKTISTSFNGG